MTTTKQYFRVLDVEITLEGPAAVIEPIRVAYRRFWCESPSDEPGLEVRLESDGSRLWINGRPQPLVEELDTTIQVYQHFLTTLMDGVGSHAILHSAALVDGEGAAVLLAAPSGHGKSSLTLELIRRGWGFLGDDYAPLDLNAASIAPYPRAVGVLPAGSAPIPLAFRERANDEAAVRLFGKSLVDVGDVLGEQALARQPAPLKHVVLLASSPETASQAQAVSWVSMASPEEQADALERLLGRIDGIEIVQRGQQARLRQLSVRVDHDRYPTAALSEILESDRVVCYEREWDTRPDFSAEPRATPIRRREAAEHLGRELLNRRAGGELLNHYRDQLPELFLDLAAALGQAACWRVYVGDYQRTAGLIEELVAGTLVDR